MNNMVQKLLDEIRRAIPGLPTLQKKVGIFICEHPQTLGLLSLSEFADRIGVSRPTVSRFCRSLGYRGFLEFSRSVQRVIEDDISHAGFFRHAYAQNDAAAGGVAHAVVERDMINMHKLLNSLPAEAISRCVRQMGECASISVVGRMSAYPFAVYFEQLLTKISDKVRSLSGSDVMQAAAISRLNERSLVFCLAFPRYSRVALDLAAQAKRRKAVVVGITNSEFSPLAPLSDILFTLDVDIVSYIDLMGPVMALINILCVEFGHAQYSATEQRLRDYDALVEESFFLRGPHVKH
ncbi:MurR/RpiR family transcriptional regulator [Desulfovibrio sp. SGI.169]|uniref:MurR/RpiR family transcriptional regulator n=1 Tax=Desulfovibrio sp. SGI.169 TaxID=3420561 RepID=UPI003CFFE85B